MKFLHIFLDLFKRKESPLKLSYEERILLLIKSNQKYPVKEIRELKSEGYSNYYEEKIDEIIGMVQTGDFKGIKRKFSFLPKTFEDLSYFSFKDENDQNFVLIVYDSDELWQDAVVFDIVKIVS